MSDRSAILEIINQSALSEFRHSLHQNPELSGEEAETALRLTRFLEKYSPDEILTGLGGHGLAFIFKGRSDGPTVLIRSELDALPIEESNNFNYRSMTAGVSHKCGHDGHMAIVAGLAPLLSARRPARGRVVLLFQPAEETGAGAAAMIADPNFQQIMPDYAFALHNLPGYPRGEVIVKPGEFSCASKGLIIRLRGKCAHSAHPGDGKSPAKAMCRIITGLMEMNAAPRENTWVTVIHARLGEVAFGTTPGEAEVMATLRSETALGLEGLDQKALQLVADAANESGLEFVTDYCEVFPVSTNNPEAVKRIISAAKKLSVGVINMEKPHRWSEDFGRFSALCKGAMFGIGAGEDVPQLHTTNYDFPDGLITRGITLFHHIVRDLLG